MTAPVRSGWVAETPVLSTATVIPAPSEICHACAVCRSASHHSWARTFDVAVPDVEPPEAGGAPLLPVALARTGAATRIANTPATIGTKVPRCNRCDTALGNTVAGYPSDVIRPGAEALVPM